MTKLGALMAATILSSNVVLSAADDRVLRAELVLPMPVNAVWDLWTTEAGLRSFFSPAATVDLKVDGLYEILFSPNEPPGKRGAEGLRIMVVEPPKRFVFTWNAPETMPSIRAQRTIVEIRLEPAPEGTRMTFTHSGWGSGTEWDQAYDYFDKAWGGFVLPSLAHRAQHGPRDWSQNPTLTALPSMRTVLRAVRPEGG